MCGSCIYRCGFKYRFCKVLFQSSCHSVKYLVWIILHDVEQSETQNPICTYFDLQTCTEALPACKRTKQETFLCAQRSTSEA